MSSSAPGQSSTPSSDFKSILDAALREYEKKTGKPLLLPLLDESDSSRSGDDPLAAKLHEGCEPVAAVIAILQSQAEAFQQFGDADYRLTKWNYLTISLLNAFSATAGNGVSLVRQ